jgi:hypothetical protein
VLETQEEYDIFWDGIENLLRKMNDGIIAEGDSKFEVLLINMSNEFTVL